MILSLTWIKSMWKLDHAVTKIITCMYRKTIHVLVPCGEHEDDDADDDGVHDEDEGVDDVGVVDARGSGGGGGG
jgi:hypothetical protein